MKIRLAKSEDLPQILDIVKFAVKEMNASGNYQWSENYPTSEVFELDIEKNELYVCDDEGTILGAVAINQDITTEYSELVWGLDQSYYGIHRLVTSIKSRGKGVAKQFFAKAEEIAKEQGLNYMRIDTNSKNNKAQSLFLKLGYNYIGEVFFPKTDTPFKCYEKIL